MHNLKILFNGGQTRVILEYINIMFVVAPLVSADQSALTPPIG